MIRGSPSRPAAFQAARVFSAPSRSLSGVPPPMIQPSAYFAVRSNAAADAAADDQRRPARRADRVAGPGLARHSLEHRVEVACRACGSRRRRPRSRPRARRPRRPAPGGPPDSASTDAACLASSAPLRRVGAIRIVVASLIRSVTAAGRGQRDQRLVVAVDDPVDRPEAGEAARLGTPRPLQQSAHAWRPGWSRAGRFRRPCPTA